MPIDTRRPAPPSNPTVNLYRFIVCLLCKEQINPKSRALQGSRSIDKAIRMLATGKTRMSDDAKGPKKIFPIRV